MQPRIYGHIHIYIYILIYSSGLFEVVWCVGVLELRLS